jgi:uncharacterized protein YprB with RNaseH-like and TPR domain
MAASPQAWPSQQPVTQPFWWPLPPLPGTPTPLEALVEGTTVETPCGTFFLRRTVFPLDHIYGPCRLGDLLGLPSQAAAALARQPELAEVPVDQLLFLDTETTGLAGGTGTYVFLVGMGAFQHEAGQTCFVIDQCLMRSFREERAMLAWVADKLARFPALATFNGRTFDVPLLQTRFALARMRADLEEVLNFDLLHVARRLWRAAVPSCALQSLERHILGTWRQDDVESFLIPAIYHQYLRDGDGRYLRKVFCHNEADILAMVALAARACRALVGGPVSAATGATARARPARAEPWGQSTVVGSSVSAAEFLGLARLYEQLGQPAAAERAYRAALGGPLAAEHRWRALLALASLLKRTNRHDEAAALWQQVADEAPAHSVIALLELSKYWEHRRRDPARAHQLATEARARWIARLPATERPLPSLSRWSGPSAPLAAPDDFERRLARLERKRQRLGPSPGCDD